MTDSQVTEPPVTLEDLRVGQLVVREREARDRWWWERMRSHYLPDSVVTLSWFQGTGPDFVTRSRILSESAIPSRHRLGPPSTRIHGDRAIVSLPAAVETYPTVDGVPVVLTAHCRLLYRLRSVDGEWRIAQLDGVYERDEIAPAVPGQQLTIDPAELEGLRAPYRLLAWTTARNGYPVSQDLPADDRPEQVREIYRRAEAWAALGER
ncbi:nuclear transport factor 2 family protein [Kitasatospora sp. NPDC015120]|uniref:nuclear transport factor 2 family protein n=1 Tax=Kitasatospora sp. NPDC015120 TaxID=3364023 RepID=UPI0036F46C63